MSNADINSLSFEEALQELENIVKTLESGNIGLDAEIEYYAKGQVLKEYCNKKLQAAKLKIEQIVSQDGVNPSDLIRPQEVLVEDL